MQKINKIVKSNLRIIALFVDFLVVIYTFSYLYWMFFIENQDEHFLTYVFVKFNPMTWGAYLLGIALLIHLIAFKNIIGQCIVAVMYVFSVVVSLVAIMGMTGWSDFAMYIPHAVVIVLAIIILVKQNTDCKYIQE